MNECVHILHLFSWRYANDDTNVTFFNWKFGEPDNDAIINGETCATMGGAGNGEFWADEECVKENKFSCEIQGSQGPNCDVCKNGFFGTLSSCQGMFKALLC